MKRWLPILLSLLSILSMTGCSPKNFDRLGLSLPSFGQYKIDRSLPSPADLKAVTSLTEVALEWRPIQNRQIAGFRVYRADKKGVFRLIKTIDDPYVTHYTDTGLEPNRRYSYEIFAYTTDGRISMPARITAPPTTRTLPPVPYFTAISGLPNRIKLIWRYHPNPMVTAYAIAKSSAPDKNFEIIKTVHNRLTVEYIDKDVQPGRRYYYKIFGKTYNGIFTQPSPVVFAAARVLPPRVTGLRATTNQPGEIKLIWDESTYPDFDHYRVYSSSYPDGIYVMIAETRANHYIDKLGKAGYKRYYKVTQVDKEGLESLRQVRPTVGTTLIKPAPPKIVAATIHGNEVHLRWQPQDDRTHAYNVIKKYWDLWRIKKEKITGIRGISYTDRNILPAKVYTYSVEAVDDNGIASDPSREVELSVQPRK